MNRFTEIAQKFAIVKKDIRDLEVYYETNIKGEVYNKRKAQLIKRLKDYQDKAKNIGSGYSVAHIRGKRRRPSKKNPTIFVIESFDLYFVAVTEEEAVQLIKLHVKNAISYKIEFIISGKIITTRN